MSYQLSTSVLILGLPDREYVLGRVQVAVVCCVARLARPFAHVQRQLLDNQAAGVASLGRRKEAINLNKRFPVASALVAQHRTNRAKTCITQRLGKTMVANHSPDIQVFDADQVKASHRVGGELMQNIFPTIGNLRVQTCHLEALLVAALAPLLLTRQKPLRSCQTLCVFGGVARIGNTFAIRQSSKAIDAQIQADAFSGFRKRLKFFVQAQGHKIATIRQLGYRCRGGRALERSRPASFEFPQTGNSQRLGLSIVLEGAARVLCALLVTFLFERWVARALVVKVLERSLQMSQRLLCRHAGNIVQPNRFRLLFELCERRRSRVVVHRRAVAIGVRTQPQRPVVNVSRAAEHLRQMLLLAGRWVNAITIANFHKKKYIFVSNLIQGAAFGGAFLIHTTKVAGFRNAVFL